MDPGMVEKEMKFFDWGRGPVPVGWAMFIVGLLLLSNSIGLLASQPYVFNGVPKEYTSTLSGSMELPYLPRDNFQVDYVGPAEVLTHDPFFIEFNFSGGRMPTFPYWVRIEMENYSYQTNLINFLDSESGPSIGTLIAGIVMPGEYEISILPDIPLEPGVMGQYELGPWPLSINTNPIPHPIPRLFDNLAFASPLSSIYPNDELLFEVIEGANMSIEDYSIETTSGNISSFDRIDENSWKLMSPDIIGETWTSFDLVYKKGSVSEKRWSYLVNDPECPIARSSGIRGELNAAFTGDDELFDQQPGSSQRIYFDGSVDLFADRYYNIKITISDESCVLSPNGFLSGKRILLPVSISIGKRTYPLHLMEDGSYEGTFKTTSSQEDDLEISVVVGYPNPEGANFKQDVRLKADHTPGFSIEPDVFAFQSFKDIAQNDVNVILSAEWEEFNRKDFASEPVLSIDGAEQAPVSESDELPEHNYTYEISSDMIFNGSSLEVRSENTLKFANWIAFLLPIPNLFIFIPIPMTGWIAVLWFVLVSIACIASVFLLFYRTARPLWRSGKKVTVPQRVKKVFSPDTDLGLTSKTYLGALFYFYAIFFLLMLFDQPTPVPGILSSETPIWIRMFLLADASVWEEISGRVVLIGIPMFIYHSMKDGKGAQWRQLVGGTGTFGNGEFFFILLSSALFGLAHLGWGPWKVLPTFVHGLLFGYLFVKVGLHASIAMHFLFDYTGFINEIIGVYGPLFIFVILTSFFLGGFFFGDWVNRGQVWIWRKWFRRAPVPLILLIIHSAISTLFGIYFLTEGGSEAVVIMFLSAPFVDTLCYLLWRSSRSGSYLAGHFVRGMVFFWSFLSFAAAPFGQAWAMEPSYEDLDHGS